MKAIACVSAGAFCGALVSYQVFFHGDLQDEGSPIYLAFVLPLVAVGVYLGTLGKPGQWQRLLCYAFGGALLLWILGPPSVSMTRGTRIQQWLTGILASLHFPPIYAAAGAVLGTLVGIALAYLPQPVPKE